MSRAAIDIGSNSILLTVVDADGAILHDEARVVGLGRGLGDSGVFSPERMKIAESVLAEYAETAKGYGVEPWSIRAVATSAARRAMNAETWLTRVQKHVGIKTDIITGQAEARLAWLGAHRDLNLGTVPVLVVDLGGGSTEIILGEEDDVSGYASLEIGSVRLTEEFLGTDEIDPADLTRLRRWVEHHVDRLEFEPPPTIVVGIAGTVTTLATMKLGLEEYDGEQIHGTRLSRTDLQRIANQLVHAGPDERRALVPAAPDRADYLLAGATILDHILLAVKRDSMIVSDRGLRFGLLAY